MFKKIALLLGLMTSMLFSLTAQATDATDPYALVDQAAKQTFARLKADQWSGWTGWGSMRGASGPPCRPPSTGRMTSCRAPSRA